MPLDFSRGIPSSWNPPSLRFGGQAGLPSPPLHCAQDRLLVQQVITKFSIKKTSYFYEAFRSSGNWTRTSDLRVMRNFLTF